MKMVEDTLNKLYVAREGYSRALILALMTKEHVVLVSPPGTAKSAMVRDLARLVRARFFMYLMTKFTEPSEIFGPLDIAALREGRYVRVTKGKLPEAEIAFLDEVFKANSAVLNSLLSVLQERVYYDGYTEIRVPLWTLIGASNEVPEEPELQALYDRFAVRVFEGYLQSEGDIMAALDAVWASSRTVDPVATMEDVKSAHQLTVRAVRAKVKQLGTPVYKVYHQNVVPFLMALRRRGEVVVSDRTLIEKLPKLYAASLLLDGLRAENLIVTAFAVLKYVARTREELAAIENNLKDMLGEIGELKEKLEKAEEALRRGDLATAERLYREVLDFDVNKLADKPWLKPHAHAAINAARKRLQQIAEIKRRIAAAAEEEGEEVNL